MVVSIFFGISRSKKDILSELALPSTRPIGFINADIPILDDLARGSPNSTDLYKTCTKCCFGPLKVPNHASLVIFTSNSVSLLILFRTKLTYLEKKLLYFSHLKFKKD